MGRPVFITGATGFVGGAILDRLIAEGTQVRALARGPIGAERLARRGAQPRLGELLGGPNLVEAMAGAGLVYHVAGLNQLCPLDPRSLFRVNVDGTARVIEAAARAGVPRVVYTSSAASLGEARGSTGSEASPHRGWFLSAYERSKFEAERTALELGARLGVEVVCVNPSSVQGPGRTSGTARWLIRYANGRLRWLIRTRVSLVDIADCTEAHLAAAARGRAGSRYLVSGPSRPIEELIRLVGEVTGRRYPVRLLPAGPAIVAGSVLGAAFRLAGRRPPICREMIRTLAHGHAYDGGRAARELGFSYTPIEESVERALRWYSDNGLLVPPLPPV